MAEKILGVDFGAARTGLAVSDDLGMYAHGIGNIKSYNAEKAAAEIAAKASELSVSLIVVGKPVNMDGSLGEKAQSAMAFADMIGGLCDIPVTLYDERCTTVSAHIALNATDTRGKKRKAVVDAVAATMILEDYLRYEQREKEQ